MYRLETNAYSELQCLKNNWRLRQLKEYENPSPTACAAGLGKEVV